MSKLRLGDDRILIYFRQEKVKNNMDERVIKEMIENVWFV